MNKRVSYWTSEIADVLGVWGRVKKKKMLLKIWQRVDYVGHKEALIRNGHETRPVRTVSEKTKEMPVGTQEEVKVKTKEIVKEKKEAIKVAVQQGADEKVIKETERAFNEEVAQARMDHGIVGEKKVLADYKEKEKEVSNVQKKKWAYYGQVRIDGKIDGMMDGKILEIKNPVKGMFGKARESYEYQVQTYMELWNVSEAVIHVEVNGSSKLETVRRDRDWWYMNVLLPLCYVDDKLKEIMLDVNKQDKLLKYK